MANGGNGVHRRGDGLGFGGPVGNGGGLGGRPGVGGSGGNLGGSGRPVGGESGSKGMGGLIGAAAIGGLLASLGKKNGSGTGGQKKGGCGTSIFLIIIIIVVVILLFSCLKNNNSGSQEAYDSNIQEWSQETASAQSYSSQTYDQLTQQPQQNTGSQQNSWFDSSNQQSSQSSLGSGPLAVSTYSNNNGILNSEVSSSARAKYTKLKGNGKDTATVLVYMCGADLESQHGAATSDLQEMINARLSDNVNLIVYTGGAKKWQNNVISSSKNQVYQVRQGGLQKLVDNAGSGAMTDPNTLAEFIQFGAQNFPADRYELIFWDHGGGSVAGYGYDEKYGPQDTMTLGEIKKALDKGGVKFDFVGYDACLMATLENGLMLDDYADYMIASEETEPATGWYYTDWLTALSNDTSIPTPQLAKKICDDYYQANSRYESQSGITISLVDLSELQNTVPSELASWAKNTTDIIQSDDYKTVSNARTGAKEFQPAQGLDQVDLVSLAINLGTDEGLKLADSLQSAIKYNRTSRSMSNAYGISIFFPYAGQIRVSDIQSTYSSIGLPDDYTKCIEAFQSTETSGQFTVGGNMSPFDGMMGGYGDLGSLAELLLGGMGGSSGGSLGGGMFDIGDLGSFTGYRNAPSYVTNNVINLNHIKWTEKNGRKVMELSDNERSLISSYELSVLYDDGEGYIDMGLDPRASFDSDGNLIGQWDGTWIYVEDQPAAFYHLDTVEDENGTTVYTGYIPCLLNGDRSSLIVRFDGNKGDGIILGYQRYYEGQTNVQAKTVQLEDGDVIDLVCDYYDYSGNFKDNYMIGDRITVNGSVELHSYELGGTANAAYKLTDIYNQRFWTPLI